MTWVTAASRNPRTLRLAIVGRVRTRAYGAHAPLWRHRRNGGVLASLGLTVTYRQLRPNPYLALRRNAIDLHYYGMDQIEPEQSHSTCSIVVPDTAPLHELFVQGLRARYGRVPLNGLPRITRPRHRAGAQQAVGEVTNLALITGLSPQDEEIVAHAMYEVAELPITLA